MYQKEKYCKISNAYFKCFLCVNAREKYYNKVSGIGYAVGYAGSLISVGLVFPLKDNPNLLFLVCAIMFFVFSLPLFLFLKEKRPAREEKEINYFTYGFSKTKAALIAVSYTHLDVYKRQAQLEKNNINIL